MVAVVVVVVVAAADVVVVAAVVTIAANPSTRLHEPTGSGYYTYLVLARSWRGTS